MPSSHLRQDDKLYATSLPGRSWSSREYHLRITLDLGMSSSLAVSHKASAPIHQLPPELLRPIFYDAQRRLRDIRFAHVCRYWRAVLLAMPEFWVSTLKYLKISSSGVPQHELLTHCLSLSSPLPVKLQVVFTGQFEYDLLAPYASRIEKLSVRWENAAAVRAFEELLIGGLPSLTSLRYDSSPLAIHRDDPRDIRALSDFSLPSLRRLQIPGALPLQMCVTDTLEHLVVYGQPHALQHSRYALGRCRSLRSLTLKAHSLQHPEPIYVMLPTDPNERPPSDDIPRLRHASVDLYGLNMMETLTQQLNMPPPECLHLCFSAACADFPDVLEIAAQLVPFPALTRLYLGRAHRAPRVQLLGYADGYRERLNITLGIDWVDNDAGSISHLLTVFTASEVTALAVNLPCLSPPLEESTWGQPGPWPKTGLRSYYYDTLAPPCALRRMELLGDMPGAAKVRFRVARWFVRAEGEDGLPSRSLTLCWVLDVARGWRYEQRAGEELVMLGKLLEELDAAGCRLGRLELYGTLQCEIIATRAEEVSTNARRCAEVAGFFLPRSQELVDVVVLV